MVLSRRALTIAAISPLLASFLNGSAARATPATQFCTFPEPRDLPDITEREAGPLKVVTTNSILADMVNEIGGDRVEAKSLIPANADSHDFEPDPSDLVLVEEADLIIIHGLAFDDWIVDAINDLDPSGLVVTASDGIETIRIEGDDASAGDPHTWFDPIKGGQMAANIAAGLAQVDPEAADAYQARLAAYQESLQDLDQAIASLIDTIPAGDRVIVTNHDALAYYAEHYGLTIAGTIIPGLDTRSEPSARELADLLDTIEQYDVKVIFAENTIDPALANALADEAGVKVVATLYTDSLGESGSGAESYIGLLQTDTCIIMENLS